MDSSHSLSYPVLIVGIVSVAAFAFGLMSWLKLRQWQSRWSKLLQGSGGASLEKMLEDHLYERRDTLEKLRSAEARIAELESRMDTSKRHLGLVRYDAFDDVGGTQSFALAVYDDLGDGAVITSLVGRADCRVYGKALNRGRSERSLSREEELAIEEASRHESRPIMSS
jgi:Protein of unknown function (DUF4446)